MTTIQQQLPRGRTLIEPFVGSSCKSAQRIPVKELLALFS